MPLWRVLARSHPLYDSLRRSGAQLTRRMFPEQAEIDILQVFGAGIRREPFHRFGAFEDDCVTGIKLVARCARVIPDGLGHTVIETMFVLSFASRG